MGDPIAHPIAYPTDRSSPPAGVNLKVRIFDFRPNLEIIIDY